MGMGRRGVKGSCFRCAFTMVTKLAVSAGSADDRAVLSAVTPDTLGLGEEAKIRWNYDDGNGGSIGRFDIALYECEDAFCGQQDCGLFVQEVCDKPSIGCKDGSGVYVITVPQNLTASANYKIRVGLHDSSLFDCTSTFTILENIPTPSMEVHVPTVAEGGEGTLEGFVADDDDASLVVESSVPGRRGLQSSMSSSNPSLYLEGTAIGFAAVNDTIMAEWTYNDGLGRSFARFNIDLYYCGGGCMIADDCGQIVARLCEACPDSDGSEMVTVPNVYSSHNYKIRVSTWSQVRRPASSCSPKFEIRGLDRPEYSTPSPTALPDDGDSYYPRPPAAEPPVEDLPSDPVIQPAEYPDWGEDYMTPSQPGCNSTDIPSVRYASTTERIYVEQAVNRGGCFTLTQIWESGTRPLYPMDPSTNARVNIVTGVWLLTEELYVLDGVTLQIHGTERGGDCDELRLLSDETTFINLRAHGGSLSFLGTKVVSWNEGEGMVDSNHEDGRSYISALSEVIYDEFQTCNGTAKEEMGEARMDVIDSEMAFLGFYDSESYGLTWKVRGYCVDKSNPEVFDNVNVYGDIINSDIHHNYFGHYSYGHQGGNWSYNKMHDNVEYGFDPHDDSDYLHIVGNDVWGNGNHGIIASKRCNHVRIMDNHVSHGVNAGLFLHRSSDYAIVTGNHVHDNGDAGLAVLESFYMDVNSNVFKNNHYGIRFSVGSAHNWIHDNIVASSTRYNIFTYVGSDLPDVEGSEGLSNDIVFWRNYLTGTYLESIKLKDAESMVIVNNRISTAATISFERCDDTTYRDNDVEEYLEPLVKTDTCFTSDSTTEPAC